MNNTDGYLIPRKGISVNIDNLYLLEVDGLCPSCGRSLLKKKGNRVNKQYEIAHIYPNRPTKSQSIELFGLERLGSDCEAYENKLALCKSCHGYYDDHTTKDEYLKYLSIKTKLLVEKSVKENLSSISIESEIFQVLSSLTNILSSTSSLIKLNHKALRISDKIEEIEHMFCHKIEDYVVIYFEYIKEQFMNLEDAGLINFDLISSEIRSAFLKSNNCLKSKPEIYYALVSWLKSKISGVSIESCEAVVSYFVQNCEVFNEIAK